MSAAAAPRDQAAGLRARPASPAGFTLAVTSGKGGVGKTCLAVNLALVLSQAGRRTCLFDGDLGLANVDVLLNLRPHGSLRDVLLDGRRLAEVVTPGPAGLQVIPAASGVEALATLAPAARRALGGALVEAGWLADVTILDTGAGISATVLRLVLAADQAALVTTPEPTAITDAYAMLKVLSQRRPALPVALVVNMAEEGGQAREVHAQLARIAGRFLGRDLPLLGWVPRDGCVERAVRVQRPLALYFPHARATESIRALARQVDRGTPPAGPGFWGRLLEPVEEAAAPGRVHAGRLE
ncbi:MAG: MinD/ParA family protein [Candidatus Methylomirabilales bacterium]